MKRELFLFAFLFLISVNLMAQTTDGLKTNKVQITFAYPIGTNGMNSMENSNNFSFNILYGLNGGLNGAEIGSILNYNKRQVTGFQLSGVTNIDMESANGLLISGILNYTKENSKGFQLSTVNFSANEFSGLQLGFFNHTKKLKGTQVGIINIVSNENNGIPVGLISIVKNGHFEFELTGGEVIYSNLSYKMGIKKLHTIFSAGYSSFKNNPVYSLGIGFGSEIPLTGKHNLSVNLTANSIAYNNSWPDNLNLLNRLVINYMYSLNNKLSLLAGPSINLYLTKEKVDGAYGTLHLPYTISNDTWSDGKLFMWIGFNAGLSYKF
jgi:hypothetical protein